MRVLLIFLGWMVLAPTIAAQDTLYFENFDDVIAPEPPSGWTLGDGWTTDAGVQFGNGSAANNLRHLGNSAEAAVSPEIDISGATGAIVSYFARRTSSYDQANMRLVASTDGGVTFSTVILPAGSALPAGDGSYDSIGVALPASVMAAGTVVFRFEGLGLNSSGANARIDDFTVTSTSEPPPPDPSTLAFANASTMATSGDGGIEIPIQLDLHPVEGLQGLQFRATWDLSGFHLVDITRGNAIADAGTWTLDFEASAQHVDVVILGEGTAAIPAGSYSPLVTLVFDSDQADVTQIGFVTLQNVVGSLATPEAGDARVFPGENHTVTLTGGQASIAVSSTNLGFGMVEVETVGSIILTISNPDGETDLEIASIDVTNPLFGIDPSSALIPPDGSLDFEVTFAPTLTEFGRQSGELVIHHNAEGGPTAVNVTGKGHSGRGDVDGDGMVDALDVIHAIDFILSRLVPTPVQLTAADLFPFPAGDLAIDVRDLTVLAQAIAHGVWPDDVTLPVEESPTSVAANGVARIVISPTGDETTRVEVAHDAPLRSLQIIFPSERDVSAGIRIDGMTTLSGYDARRSEVRVLGYVTDGSALAPGRLELTIPGEVGLPRYASAVDDQRRHVRVDASVSTSTRLPDDNEDRRLEPYPNPYSPTAGRLSLGLKGRLEVYDLLGREVYSAEDADTWEGRDLSGRTVAPGLYIVRLDTDEFQQTRTVTVVR